MVNPIVDWDDSDVWEFLNSNNIPHCCLYDEGFKRLGCIGCPLSGSKNMERDFERWPKYKEMYIRAFQRMIDNHPGQIRILDPNADTKFKLEIDGGGYAGFGIGSNGADSEESPDGASTLPEFAGGGYSGGVVPLVGRVQVSDSLSGSSPTVIPDNPMRGGVGGTPQDSLPRPCWSGGRRSLSAEWLFRDWVTHDGCWSTQVKTRFGNGDFHAVSRKDRR